MNNIFTQEFINSVSGSLTTPAMLQEKRLKQPLHTVYGGAQMFTIETFDRIRETALRQFNTYAANPAVLKQIFPATGVLNFPVEELHESLLQKLQKTPVEDYRIDFEDGYGYRPDEEENNHAITAATAAAGLILAKKTPEYFGFRVKPLSPATFKRSLMTMEMFLTQLAKGLDGYIPKGLLITLPKVETISQVKIFNQAIDMILQKNGWPAGTLRTEIMIETPSAILTQQGMANLPLLIEAAGDRLFAVHAGLYDFTGALDIAATDQMYQHQYCNFLRFMMLVSANNAGVHVSDGATSFLPVGKYKKPENSEQSNENKRIVWKAWRLHFDNVLHSLAMGIVQGWDLHPGQIPARLVAVYYYYRKDKDKLMSRFFNFVKSAAQATQQSGNFDDAATGQGMLNFLLKGYECGALNDGDFAGYGINPESLKSRSFPKICEAFNNKKSN